MDVVNQPSILFFQESLPIYQSLKPINLSNTVAYSNPHRSNHGHFEFINRLRQTHLPIFDSIFMLTLDGCIFLFGTVFLDSQTYKQRLSSSSQHQFQLSAYANRSRIFIVQALLRMMLSKNLQTSNLHISLVSHSNRATQVLLILPLNKSYRTLDSLNSIKYVFP